MQFDIKNRWSGEVQFTASIDCATDAAVGVKLGLAVRWARMRDAVLRDADLRDAVLRGADLRDAVLRGADLRDADLSGADLRDAVLRGADLRDAPIIPDIHRAVYAAASAPGALDMSQWHRTTECGTTHCRAGWVVTLAGVAGKALEARVGTPAAATLIYLASDPQMGVFPDFYSSNDLALADMKMRAEQTS
jgi:hypothetical protein